MSIIKAAVDQAFEIAALTRQRTNPVTGEFLVGHLMGDPQIDRQPAYRAVLAREAFALDHPTLKNPLPLTDAEIDRLKKTGDENRMIALFAASLKANDWDLKRHPSFRDFGGGVLSLSDADLLTLGFKDLEGLLDLVDQFSPHPLQGLWPDATWRPKVGH